MSKIQKRGFTLIELLVVMGILGVLMATTILVINPAEYLARARDTQRASDLNTLVTAINLYIVNGHNLLNTITPNDCYYSAANGFLTIDDSGFCAVGTPVSANSRAIDGTGWLPINFSVDNNSPISVLPVDPSNNTMYYETYVEGSSPVVRLFPYAYAYTAPSGTSTYKYYYTYGFVASANGTYKLVAKLEAKASADKMVNDGGISNDFFEMGSDTSLQLEPGMAPPATTTTTAPSVPKYIFVTNGTWNGNLGGLAGADAKCQTAASNAGLSGDYMALITDSDTYLTDRLIGNNSYILFDNTLVANNPNELTSSAIQAAVNRSDLDEVLNTSVWTGSDAWGDPESTCSNWTSANAEVSANAGLSSANNGTWLDNGTAACNLSKSLYCVEE